MSDNENSSSKGTDTFNRSTLEVARTIIDGEVIATRSKKYLKEESRLGFLSVWSAFNAAFSTIADLYEDKATPEFVKEKLEAIYKGIPVGFNLPLESRIPPNVRAYKVEEADEVRKDSGAPDKIIVRGYNDPESLAEWEHLQVEQETERRKSLLN